MTEVRNNLGYVTSFSIGDILTRYRAGAGAVNHLAFDNAAFMASPLGLNVRPTSFDAFTEVSAFVKNTGQAISIEQYYADKYYGEAIGA